ncbi:MAG: ABC transporter ATP-binding protein, partial [Eubacterium sp.]|nr:ABC transporter ATP-binding protein [Eubacterium sp.]
IIIIDEGKKIYDNDIEHLKTFFGSYRTLRMRLEDGSWDERVIDEKKTDVMHVIQETQKKHVIKDIQLQEISTEEVIRKIYEGSKAS